jgi:ATP-dependent RNA helicase DeaD
MLQDVLFTEPPTEDDLTLAKALLAERSPEDIATALARVYRSRLPSPEDVSDPGQDSRRSRDDRGERRDARPTHGDDRDTGPRRKRPPRDGMPGGSVWFRASIGRQKNAEARWLLPMICRRGGIDKHDIGAIRIFETNTEFEISAQAAEQFAVRIKNPDKEAHIRIEALTKGPQSPAPAEKPPRDFAGRSKRYEGKSRPERVPEENVPTFHGKPSTHGAPKKFDKPGFKSDKPAFNKKPHKGGRPYKGKRKPDDATPFAKPAFRVKPKKDKNRA